MQNTIRKFGQLIAGSLIGAGLAVPSLADDIDVFYSTLNNPGDAETMVMFSLDWRPNLYSTICNGACPEYQATLGSYLDCEDGTCNTIKRYEVLKAALKLVVDEVTAGGDSGLKFGIMLNHDHFAQQGNVCNDYQGPGNSVTKKCSNGGYILLGFVDADDPVERQKFFEKLDALPSPQGNESHKYQGAELYFEFFRYLTGQGVYNGYNGWFDFGTNIDVNIDDKTQNDAAAGGSEVTPWGSMGWDENAISINSPVYVSPLAQAGECSSVYTVNFLHQVSQQDSDSDNDIKATKANGGMEGIGNNPDFEATIGYLHDVDLADGSFNSNVDLEGDVNVTSYFIVDPSKVNTTTNGYAEAGGTGEALSFQDDPEELVALLRNIVQEILAESTTFVSTAVAANTLNRAQTREELYIALFEANEDKEPFWDGNTKKIKIITIQVPVVDEFGNPVVDGEGNPLTEDKQALVDANNTDAVNSLDGRLKASALTFWTDDTSLSPTPPDETDYTDSTDGREVARGGAGQRIPGFLPSADPGFSSDTGRNVLTEPASYTNGTPVSLIDLDADSATAVDLLTNDNALYQTVMNCTSCTYSSEPDTSKQTEAVNKVVNMLKFSRGYDVPFDDADYSSPDGRDWWVGAPLHSRPLILNFGNRGSYTGTQPDIRILTAGNAGVLHMVKDSNPDGTSNGTESWAFLPREFIPAQKRFMENVKGFHSPGIPSASPVLPAHPYLLDSSAVALYIDNDQDGTIETGDSDKVWVYICMRRGGKGCYALDLSNPDDPKLMWTIDKADADFGEMAQTWSRFRPGLVAYEDSGGDLVQTVGLFFGAGYNGDDGGDRFGDLGKDDRTGSVGTDDYEGNGVFVVDARDGSLIWKAVGPEDGTDNGNGWSPATNTLEVPDMKDSIPGDIFLFDSDGDGITDRIYFADTGGILWRGDIVPGPRSVWTMTRMLNFGRHYSATNADDRRAFPRVDVAKARELEPGQLQVGDPFDAVVVTTGDRAHPTGTDVEDWVYMFKDKNIASGAPPLPPILDHDDLQDLTDNCLQDGNNSDCPDLAAGELPKLDNGWKVRLNHCGDAAISVGTDCGEKGLSRPLIINNTVFFTTYLPPAASGGMCELAQGKGLFYAMKLQNATAVFDFNLSNNNNGVVLDRFDELASPGIPPAPVALSSGTILRPDLVLEERPPLPNGPTFWYETYLK